MFQRKILGENSRSFMLCVLFGYWKVSTIRSETFLTSKFGTCFCTELSSNLFPCAYGKNRALSTEYKSNNKNKTETFTNDCWSLFFKEDIYISLTIGILYLPTKTHILLGLFFVVCFRYYLYVYIDKSTWKMYEAPFPFSNKEDVLSLSLSLCCFLWKILIESLKALKKLYIYIQSTYIQHTFISMLKKHKNLIQFLLNMFCVCVSV